MLRLKKVTRVENGKLYRFCTGPYCRQSEGGGKWFELSKDNFYVTTRKGKRIYRSQCKRCHSHHVHKRSDIPVHGVLPVAKAKPALDELIQRIGKAEIGRRIGMSQQSIWRITHNEQKTIRRITALRIFNLLKQVRSEGEWRTPEDIHHNRKLRGLRAEEARQEDAA